MNFIPDLKSARASLATAGFMLFAWSGASAETLATVNGVDIDSGVLDAYIQTRLQRSPDQVTPEERNMVLEELTDIYLLTTQPKAKELTEDPQFKAQAELQYRGLLTQIVAADYLANNPASDAAIEAAYAQQIQLAPSQQYKARHILVETQVAADELIGQLVEGADFVTLAQEHSTGPSGPNGGDLGWFSPDQMVAPFSDAVAGLEDGEFTKTPVQTQFGWHVILREDSRDNEPPTLDSVRDVIKQRVEQEQFQSYIQSLREENKATE